MSPIYSRGILDQKSYESEVISWKIHSVSCLEITEDTVIRSPQFSYKEATWILKMYPYEKNDFNKGSITVQIERLHSNIPEHHFLSKMAFKADDSTSHKHCCFVQFDLEHQQQNVCLENWYKMFYHNKNREFRRDDTIILEVEILMEKNVRTGLDTENISFESPLGSERIKNDESLKSTGELLVESFDVDIVTWKIRDIHSISPKVNKKIQSAIFSFDGASWLLNLFLYGQTNFESKSKVDVMIERLQSHIIQKHPVLYEIHIYGKNPPPLSECSGRTDFPEATGFFTFESDHSQKNILEISTYNSVFDIATSDFGRITLKCDFRRSKKSEIGLDFEKESAQSITDSMYFTPESFEKPEIGKIVKKSLECEVISWTIPNILSLVTSKNTQVQSPSFSYKDATWNLTLETRYRLMLEVVLERLHSQIPAHHIFCNFFFKTKFGKQVRSDIYVFDGSRRQRAMVCVNSDLYKRCNRDDAFTLECELYSKKIFQMDSNIESSEAALGNRNATSEDTSKSADIFSMESFDVELITWKIPEVRSMPLKVDYGVQSVPFSFAGASWILKLFPYGQKKFESEKKVDLIIERIYSAFSSLKLPVSYTIFFKSSDEVFNKHVNPSKDLGEKEFIFEVFDENRFFWSGSHQKNLTRGSFIFEANNVQENICNVESCTKFFKFMAPNQSYDTNYIICALRIGKKAGNRLDFRSNSVKSDAVSASTQGTSKEKPPAPFEAFSLEASSQETSREKTSAPFEKLSLKGSDRTPSYSVNLPFKKLHQDLKELFLNQEDCDAVLKVKGQEFQAHKAILRARSPVFASTFRNEMKEKVTGVVDIEDCDPSSFSEFLCFLYCGCIEKLSTENVFSLFTTADKYDVQDLRSQCVDFMKKNLSIDNFCDTITLALKHTEKKLIKLTTNFFAKNHQKIILTVKWQSFLIENPIQGNELLIKALVSDK